MNDTDGVRLQPTACPFLAVGKPVSMRVDGRAVAWHRSWYVYGRDTDAFGEPTGEYSGPLGPPRPTRAEAVLYAEQVRCPVWHGEPVESTNA